MGYMGNPDWEYEGIECLARWISQVISLLNMWKSTFQFPLCLSLHNSPSCGNVSFLTFQQCRRKRPSRPKALHSSRVWKALLLFPAIGGTSTLGCQPSVYSDRVCSAKSPALPPHLCHCHLSAGAAWLHALQDATPHPPLTWFCNDTSKMPYAPMCNSSSLDKPGSSWELPLTSPELTFLIQSMSSTSTQGRGWEKEEASAQILLCLLYSFTFYVSAWPSAWAARCNLKELLSFIHELPCSCSLEEHGFKRWWWVC